MIICQACGNENLEGSQYCDECGTRLAKQNNQTVMQPPPADNQMFQPANVTSVGIPPIVEEIPKTEDNISVEEETENEESKGVHATLTIERGSSVGTEFNLTSEESYIGRWDADNGVFPDVDLDSYDDEAKISRRHARIVYRNDSYTIEDLGSTNGTYVNRGRRLIPGNPHRLDNGDEIIVGKVFLRLVIKK
jgi:pSer/pThr/pTyr-binding forkhead associated (FHA) protein